MKVWAIRIPAYIIVSYLAYAFICAILAFSGMWVHVPEGFFLGFTFGLDNPLSGNIWFP